MIQIILLIVALVLTVAIVLLIRSFEYMTIAELRRQAHAGNLDAKVVYPVRAYGIQLWMVLWSWQGIITSGIVLLLHNLVGAVWTLVVAIPLVVLVHAILPWSRWPKPNLHLAAIVSPALERILKILYPVLHFGERAVGRWILPEPILLIQSKDELLEILRHNAEEFDHVNPDELKIAENALVFGDKLIGDHMTPLKAIYFVKADEHLTPVVLGELHNSGYSRFPVIQGTNQNIIGTLFIKDAMQTKEPKSIKDVMRPEVYFINEHQTLDHALKAFLRVRHHMFVVVNEFEDVVGVLSVEDVLEQIIGRQMGDEFDQFDDKKAVAKHHSNKKSQEQAANDSIKPS
jgi:CBS domain containing-hemolysin-like protein